MSSRHNNYHTTGLSKYFNCPREFELSTKIDIEISSDAMTKGLLIEGYVLGFKDKLGYSESDIRGIDPHDKRKGMKDATVQPIKDRAELIKPFFVKGESFVSLFVEEQYKFMNGLAGEADFIGDVFVQDWLIDQKDFDGERVKINNMHYIKKRVIADLKDTSNIHKSYNYLNSKKDILQAIMYPYLWYRMTGEVLDFVYMVCENNFKENLLMKQIYVPTVIENFEWLVRTIQAIDNDIVKMAVPTQWTCIKNQWGRNCDYIEYCEHGRELVGRSERKEFHLLDDPILPNSVVSVEKLKESEPLGNQGAY